jgi:hypothetical protein
MKIEETFKYPNTDAEAIERIKAIGNDYVLRYYNFCRERLDVFRAWNETMCMYSRCSSKEYMTDKWA